MKSRARIVAVLAVMVMGPLRGWRTRRRLPLRPSGVGRGAKTFAQATMRNLPRESLIVRRAERK